MAIAPFLVALTWLIIFPLRDDIDWYRFGVVLWMTLQSASGLVIVKAFTQKDS
jgi:hypothetical protein